MNGYRTMRRAARAASAAAIGLALAAGPVHAQSAPRVLTLEEAIAVALERNPTVQQAENSARLGTLAVRQEQRSLLPDLSISTAATTPYAAGVQQDPWVSAGLSTSVQVGNVYTTLASIERARLEESGAGRSLDRARQTVTYTVVANYLSVLEAEEQVRVQEENLRSVESREAQIEALVAAGSRPISDLYQQQASTAAAQLGVVQAERSLTAARMGLIRTLQLDPFGEYTFEAPDAAALTATTATMDATELSRLALGRRPDLAAAELDLGSARQGVRIAEASRWPSLSLSLGYGAGFSSVNPAGLFDQLDADRGGSVQIGVSIPLLDATSGITRERARIQVENARIALESTRNTVAAEIQTAYLDRELAEQQLAVAELQLRAAELALETAQQRYDVGAGTLLEVTQARAAQVSAASDLVNARYGLLLQNRLLEYYAGGVAS